MHKNANSGGPVGKIAVRLNSWKEIATYFDRDVRTVRRWEATRGLPVHRVPGGARSGVFAYVAELEEWLSSSRGKETAGEPAAPGEAAERDSQSEAAWVPTDERPDPALEGGEAFQGAGTADHRAQGDRSSERAGRSRIAAWWVAAAAGLALVAGAAGYLAHRQNTRAATVSYGPGTGFRPSANGEAQELYLRGLYLWNQRTEPSLTQSVDLFTQAIVHDPHFAAAYAALADSYLLLRQYGHMADRDAFPRALAAARQALSLDEGSYQAHRSYAFVLNYWIWDFPAADAEFRRSIALKGDEAQTHSWYATSLYSEGKYEEALREIDEARRLHPDSISILTNRGLLLATIDRSAALAYLRELEKGNPAFPTLHTYVGDICLAEGDYRCYLEEHTAAASERRDTAEVELLNAGARELERHGPQGMLSKLAAGYGEAVDGGQPGAMQPASLYARLGNWERTLHFLSVAAQRRESTFLAVSGDPAYKPLYGTAEFKALLAKRNTPLEVASAVGTGD